jgi:hypothetical protein
VQQSDDPGEMLYWLMSDLDRARSLAELHPNRELRDAIVVASSPQQLLEHFATVEGRKDWEELKAMHPLRLNQALGALTTQLKAAPRDSAPAAPAPITAAVPSAKSPVGSPRARSAPASSAAPKFDDWMAEEDAKERAERLRAAGLSVPA